MSDNDIFFRILGLVVGIIGFLITRNIIHPPVGWSFLNPNGKIYGIITMIVGLLLLLLGEEFLVHLGK